MNRNQREYSRQPESRRAMRASLLNGRVLTAAIMLVIFLTMSFMALGFPEKARLMPLLVGVPGSLLALAQLFAEIRAGIDPATALPEASEAVSRSERQMFIWMLVFFLGILGFGFTYAAPLLVFAFLSIGKQESLSIGVAGALGTWAVLYGLFETVFEIPLFEGLVAAWLLA